MRPMLAVLVLAAAAVLAGCAPVNPCATLAPPNAAELAVAAGRPGIEVEVDVDGTDCQLVGGGWVREED